MFTGIVAERGTIVQIESVEGTEMPTVDALTGAEATAAETARDTGSVRLHLEAGAVLEDLPTGGSLSVDGVCLTATPLTGVDAAATAAAGGGAGRHRFVADVMGETLARTTLGGLRAGSTVNLERCTPAGGRLDGHVVQGHVDAVGTVLERVDHGSWETLRIGIPAQIAGLLAQKGAIAVDGVSLTVTAVSPAPQQTGRAARLDQHWFEIGLIPATLAATGLGQKSRGDRVNLETDVMAKYAARLSSFRVAPASWSDAAADRDEIALDTVEEAVRQIRSGGAVVVVDDEDRENEGDLVFAAVHATPELVGFTVRWSSGVLCVPLTGQRADELGLPPMTAVNEDAKGTAYTVTCDARDVVSTGISAQDRATTARVLASPASTAADLTRPGHVLPLRAAAGGVLERRGHTEAAVDLCRLAGLPQAGVIAELVHDDGSMQRLPDLRGFATRHRLPLISIDDLARRLRAEPSS
ncbi:3,4-dihydroxy-2-butanone-4-phosphate synthase [Kocuria palustris]|uniref:3,4-dihydroxy-2-butanone-4-phosphate synthase n=1 Tax=Kocuria palustris TaxID=71999 RepID=UPI0016427A9D|nr:3,4-dihydroxy-2-butanone-4-phosphate synthase [Kocuria palustris]